MIGKQGEGESSSSVAIFATIVVVLIAVFGFVAYANGFFPFGSRVVAATPVVIHDQPTVTQNNITQNTYNTPVVVHDNPPVQNNITQNTYVNTNVTG